MRAQIIAQLKALKLHGMAANRDVATVLAMPEVKESFAAQGIVPETSTPAQLGDYVKRDVERWKRFVTEQNITLD